MKEKRQFAVFDSQQMDHLRVFHEVARALTQTLELEEILLTIMDKMAQFFGPERWSMLMVDDAAQQLYYAIAVGEDAESLKGLRVPLGELPGCGVLAAEVELCQRLADGWPEQLASVPQCWHGRLRLL